MGGGHLGEEAEGLPGGEPRHVGGPVTATCHHQVTLGRMSHIWDF